MSITRDAAKDVPLAAGTHGYTDSPGAREKLDLSTRRAERVSSEYPKEISITAAGRRARGIIRRHVSGVCISSATRADCN